MSYTIVSGNKLSSCTSKSYKYSIYRNALIKCQIFVRNLNMSKTKWDGDEEPTINNVLLTK